MQSLYTDTDRSPQLDLTYQIFHCFFLETLSLRNEMCVWCRSLQIGCLVLLHSLDHRMKTFEDVIPTE